MKYELKAPILEKAGCPSLIYVTASSDMDLKKHLATIAQYFKKEFRFDHIQYDEYDEDPDCIGVLMCEWASGIVESMDHFPYYVIGGGCFRKSDTGKYSLDWVWIHPFARNRGKLKSLWPKFKSRFGDFSLQEPLSPHMKLFIQKRSE